MHALEELEVVKPFPLWEIWGVSVTLPLFMGAGLSLPVEKAVGSVVENVAAIIFGERSLG